MNSSLKEVIKQILAKMPVLKKINPDVYIISLRNKGIQIGDRSVIFDPHDVFIDPSRPYLIEIGNDVQITRGVTILTHDYSWSVLKHVHGEVLGSAGKVRIGNNVFIGMQTTILKGVTIGDNVIIGANSLVSHDIPSNCVAAGNPAKFIMDLDAFYAKRKDAQFREAAEQALQYKARYGSFPPKEEMNEFFWLFEPRERTLNNHFIYQMKRTGNYEQSMKVYRSQEAKFKNYDSFLEAIKDIEDE